MSELAASPRRWRTAFFACLVLAVTCAAYLPSLRNGFTNWDDPYYVTANTAIHSLSWPAVKLIFSSSVLGMYHPLSILSLAGDYHYFGLDPRGYHAVNLALHLANTLLVFGLLRLLCGNLAAAVAGSLLFGVHPLHVESGRLPAPLPRRTPRNLVPAGPRAPDGVAPLETNGSHLSAGALPLRLPAGAISRVANAPRETPLHRPGAPLRRHHPVPRGSPRA